MDIYQYPQMPPDNDKPSLVLDMPNDVYHATKGGISKSGLDLIERGPAHYYHEKYVQRRESTRAMEIGTAIHTAVLEPLRFVSEYQLLTDCKDRRQAEYKSAVAQHGTEKVLIGSEIADVSGMSWAVSDHPVAHDLLKQHGHREASLFVCDPESGARIRCRYDLLLDGGQVVDLKKTQDVRPDAFEKTLLTYRYHVQAALYLDAWGWATGETPHSFKILAVEEKAPHGVAVYQIDDMSIWQGRIEYRQNINTFLACEASGIWPSHTQTEAEFIGLPAWRVRQIENDLEVNNINFGD